MGTPVPPIGGIGSPRVQAALQDYLIFSYFNPANSDIVQRLGNLGDALIHIRKALNALNSLNAVATLSLDKSQLNYTGGVLSGTGSTALWNARSELVKGFDVLQAMSSNNELEGNANAVSDVLNQSIVYTGGTTTLAGLVAAIKGTTLNQAQNVGIVNQLVAWFDGGTSVQTDKQWGTQTNLSNAALQFEFLNDASRDRLQAAMVVYQEFANSASMALNKINSVFRDIANQIG